MLLQPFASFHYIRRRGFTLMETIVVVGISAILMLGVGIFMVDVFRYNGVLVGQIDANRQLSRATIQMTREIRTAEPSSLGGYSLESPTATSLIYYANINGDAYTERIRYFLDGTNLKRGVIRPSGTPLSYNPANESIVTVVEHVTNSDIFTYYDQNYDGTSAPLSSPVPVTSIRLIRIRIVVRGASQQTQPIEADTSVEIRNLKLT